MILLIRTVKAYRRTYFQYEQDLDFLHYPFRLDFRVDCVHDVRKLKCLP